MRSYILLLLAAFTLFMISCSDDSSVPGTPDVNPDFTGAIWTGNSLSFTKQAGADPTQEVNQDRITDNVWITRGNDGGQIYNAKSESGSNKNGSPAGTLWAEGELSEINSLSFQHFRTAVGNPKNVVGRSFVVYLVDDNIFLNIRFNSWSQRKSGGFSYERSTPE